MSRRAKRTWSCRRRTARWLLCVPPTCRLCFSSDSSLLSLSVSLVSLVSLCCLVSLTVVRTQQASSFAAATPSSPAAARTHNYHSGLSASVSLGSGISGLGTAGAPLAAPVSAAVAAAAQQVVTLKGQAVDPSACWWW
jgi:hypothetical protein